MLTLTLAILQIRTVRAVTQVHYIPKALTLTKPKMSNYFSML